MFGGGNAFGSSAFGQQQQQQPQQQQNSLFGQQPQQQQSTFGGFGATSAAPNAFGASNTGMSAFGATPGATTSAFGGQPSTPAFGSTSNNTSAFNARPSAFGSSAFGANTQQQQQPATSGFGFGATPSTTPAFGSSTTPATGGGLFGSRPAATSAFGSTAPTTGGGVFGAANPTATSGFGASTSTPFGGGATGQVQGTVNPEFTATTERDTSTGVNNSYQTITAMPAYRNYSVEELRVQDYQAGRKNAGTSGGAFGAAGGFGGQTATPFGQSATSNSFGMPSTSAAGSAFGQTTGGFGQSAGGFGQASTGGFGSTNTGASGGLFGQQSSTAAPAFGSTQPATTGFGGGAFGQQPQQQQQNTGFGATANTGFGASSAAKPFSFGSTPATSQPATGFGATGASPFGQQPQQQQPQQQQSVGGLFGQAAQSTPSFGQQATGSTFGFGQKPATQATSGFGGFGATNANKPAPSFNFGSAAPPATSTAATSGFGGFGANTGAAGFGSTGAASGGLFGASKPAASTGLFGAAPQGSSFGGFGATNNTGLGSGLFGAKPATNNAAAPSLFGNTQQTTGGFGFGNQQNNSASTFSLPGTGGLTTFGTTGLQQQPNANQQPPLYASLDKYPYGYNPLFENLPAGTSGAERSSSVAVSEEPSKKLSTTPHFMITPRSATKIKLRGYSFAPTGELVSRKTGGLDGISDDAVLRPEAFAPRPSIKRLIITKKVSPSELSAATNSGTGVLSAGSKAKVTFDPHLELIASQHQADNEARELTQSEQQASAPETSKPTNRNTAFSDNAMAQGYYIKPSLQVLGNQSRQQLKNTQHLVVGLKGVGEITFEGPVDLSEIDLDQIMVGIVNFQPKTCTVYPDEDAKPAQGKGLNVPATIKLEKCYPVDKTTRQPITDPQHPRVIAIIRKLRAVPETEFIDFEASTGTWTFKDTSVTCYLEADGAFGSREVERANTLLQFTALVHMAAPHSAVPDIPGVLQYEPALSQLKQYVANLLQMRSYRFPGAQPVSFRQDHLRDLENEDYFVAEKSDGVRCLALITVNRTTKEQEVYLFDRKSNFFLIPKLRFPIPNDPAFQKCHTDTIIDGELVHDTEPDGRVRQRLLLFDCLVIAGKVLVERDLSKRLGYLKMDILRPYQLMLQRRPDIAASQPFSVEFKEQQFSYHLETIFNEIIPNLKHGNDGLIFTSVNGSYTLGTCQTMLKWKPANENSIDFKISLEFPPSGTIPGVVDTTAKPRIALWVWRGGRDYIPFGEMGVTDEEWFRDFAPLGRSLEGRIVECNYDIEVQQRLGLSSPWRFMRYRTDKPDANHKSTVDKVLGSIHDGITQQELVERAPYFRQAWMQRVPPDPLLHSFRMGNCLGSRKPSGNRLNEPGDVARKPAGPQPDAATAREMRLAAAEGRQKKHENRGVQSSGGKLSQNLQAQSKLKPGQETEENVERIVWD